MGYTHHHEATAAVFRVCVSDLVAAIFQHNVIDHVAPRPSFMVALFDTAFKG